ncbi:hypothetical protein CYJ61_04780 [Gardnerella leopoldii]|uniref:Uncharacterized protein n=1 Tax=Gardnerella vaginalis TaxID=2702 RepID=A0AAP8LRY5_GARVA|nr:hypothetical protein CYJ61_04780 [Gardnerella vaginalis]
MCDTSHNLASLLYFRIFEASCAIYERALSSIVRYLFLFVIIYVQLIDKFSRMSILTASCTLFITFTQQI